MTMALDIRHPARWCLLGVVLLVGVPMRRGVWACRRQATWFQLLLCSHEDLRFLILGAVLFPTDRFPMGAPGCSPRVRLCKVHMVPVWERVWRKSGLFILLRKFRFTADESVHVEVWVSESSVGWSLLQGLNSQSSPASGFHRSCRVCSPCPSLSFLLSFH